MSFRIKKETGLDNSWGDEMVNGRETIKGIICIKLPLNTVIVSHFN